MVTGAGLQPQAEVVAVEVLEAPAKLSVPATATTKAPQVGIAETAASCRYSVPLLVTSLLVLQVGRQRGPPQLPFGPQLPHFEVPCLQGEC